MFTVFCTFQKSPINVKLIYAWDRWSTNNR